MLHKQINKIIWISLIFVLLFYIFPSDNSSNDIEYASIEVNNNKPNYVILGGSAVGFEYQIKGVLVMSNNRASYWKNENKNSDLRVGDLIVSINNTVIEKVSDISKILNSGQVEEKVIITLYRNGEKVDVEVNPIFDYFMQKYTLGVWVKDNVEGLGTLTYINPENNKYGALGHPITETDSGQVLSVKSGYVYDCNILGVAKGAKGVPGELRGMISKNRELGSVENNNDFGIYGTMNNIYEDEKLIEVGGRVAAKPGKAQIYCTTDNNGVKAYDIQIIKTNYQAVSNSKSLVFKVVDKELLEKTGGIVQGMSGSPIVQDGKLVGAVTHVFLNDSTKGFGIYIDWML